MTGEHAECARHEIPSGVSDPHHLGFQRTQPVQVHGVVEVAFGLVFEQDSKVVVDVDARAHGGRCEQSRAARREARVAS